MSNNVIYQLLEESQFHIAEELGLRLSYNHDKTKAITKGIGCTEHCDCGLLHLTHSEMRELKAAVEWAGTE